MHRIVVESIFDEDNKQELKFGYYALSYVSPLNQISNCKNFSNAFKLNEIINNVNPSYRSYNCITNEFTDVYKLYIPNQTEESINFYQNVWDGVYEPRLGDLILFCSNTTGYEYPIYGLVVGDNLVYVSTGVTLKFSKYYSCLPIYYPSEKEQRIKQSLSDSYKSFGIMQAQKQNLNSQAAATSLGDVYIDDVLGQMLIGTDNKNKFKKLYYVNCQKYNFIKNFQFSSFSLIPLETVAYQRKPPKNSWRYVGKYNII